MEGLQKIKAEIKNNKKLMVGLVLIFLAGAAVRSMTAGYPYLIGADPYYHLRFAEYIAFDHTFPTIDPLAWFPDQPVLNPPLLYLLLALPNLLTGTISPFFTLKFFNLLTFLVTFVGAFIISRKVLKPNFALLALLFFALSPQDVSRSLVGLFRPENLAVSLFIFSVLAVWSSRRKSKAALFALAAAIPLVWSAYPLLIVPLLAVSILEDTRNKKLQNTPAVLSGLLLALLTFWGRLYMKYGLPKNLEVYDQIQELYSPIEGITLSSLPQWLLTGSFSFAMGTFVFLLFIGGSLIVIKQWYRNELTNRYLAQTVLIALFFFVISLRYGRFMHLLIPFSAIMASFALEHAFERLKDEDRLTHILLFGILGLTILFTLIPLVGVYNDFKSIDDPKVMNSNREAFYLWMGTLEDGVVLANSDDGHYITAVAKQRVVADNNIAPYSFLASKTMSRFKDISEFYISPDWESSYSIARRYNASYVLVDPLYRFQIETFMEVAGKEVAHPERTVLVSLIQKDENPYFRLLRHDESTKYGLLLYEVLDVDVVEPQNQPSGGSPFH